MNEADSTEHHSGRRRRRRKSRKHGPLYASLYLFLIGMQWVALFSMALLYLRPKPLVTADYFMGLLGMCLGGFYLWTAWGVYHRRRYIYTPAFAAASFGIVGFPCGTLLAVLLIIDLSAHRHEFDK